LKAAVARKKGAAVVKKEESAKKTQEPVRKTETPVKKTQDMPKRVEPETKKRANPPDEPEPPVDIPEPVPLSSSAPPLKDLIMSDDRIEELSDKLAVFRAVLKRYGEIEKGKKAQIIVDDEIKRLLGKKK